MIHALLALAALFAAHTPFDVHPVHAPASVKNAFPAHDCAYAGCSGSVKTQSIAAFAAGQPVKPAPSSLRGF